jgi:hypothetical protein
LSEPKRAEILKYVQGYVATRSPQIPVLKAILI